MRPNPERLLNPNIGDIVLNFINDKYYLILDVKHEDNDKYYDALCLNNGKIDYLGIWEYLYMTSWDIVA